MPVGTKATIKGLTARQVTNAKCIMILANTFHLCLRPGKNALVALKGVKAFSSWKHGLLTDSGGFQMVSLAKISRVSEEGVMFQSPYSDGSEIFLSPEESIAIQNSIDPDILMQLDDVVSPLSKVERISEATLRSLRWYERCVSTHNIPTQSLFPIIQGGVDLDLRATSIASINNLNAQGVAIGGLGGGENKKDFSKLVDFCTSMLPRDMPVYCMGIGYIIDIIVSVIQGVDMFDCVYPTRTARFGNALTTNGSISLKNGAFASDFNPIADQCNCFTCSNYSRAYIHFALEANTIAVHLISMHNIYFMMNFMNALRASIIDGTIKEFAKVFMLRHFGDASRIPSWISETIVKAFSCEAQISDWPNK
jgi:queuine tRNA-ribosyltransferase catalytic subunit